MKFLHKVQKTFQILFWLFVRVLQNDSLKMQYFELLLDLCIVNHECCGTCNTIRQCISIALYEF